MIPSVLLPIANHLWQSTLFAGVAGLLTLLLRKNRAHARYWLWLAASAKFLLPFSLLVLVGGVIGRHAVIAPTPSRVSIIVEQVNEPFVVEGSLGPMLAPSRSRSESLVVPLLIALWAIGCGALVLSWWLRWRRIRVALRAGSPVPLRIGVPVLYSAAVFEPGVVGVFHPVLLLPAGIGDQLAPAELRAILAHELCHVRRRDNLATVVHMVVEAVFWFHPLVWWLGARLMEERERACDEEVLRTGSEPEAYAEGILKVCELYLQSPLKCVAGVTGTNLKKRIEAIMNNRPALKLNLAKRVGLTIAGVLAVALPVILGVTDAPTLRAQAQVPPKFEVASIRPCVAEPGQRTGGDNSSPGRLRIKCTPVRGLIIQAYLLFADSRFRVGLPPPIEGGPPWIDSQDYEVNATAGSDVRLEIMKGPMLQALLEDRFKLKVHRGTREVPIYNLVVAKGGLKLPAFKEGSCIPVDRTQFPQTSGPPTPDQLQKNCHARGTKDGVNLKVEAQGMTIDEFAKLFLDTHTLGRPVINKTDVTGRFDFHLEYAPDTSLTTDDLAGGPSIFTALQEQLGLRLESARGPGEVLVIDHIEQPSEN